jgi:hypothetical protein
VQRHPRQPQERARPEPATRRHLPPLLGRGIPATTRHATDNTRQPTCNADSVCATCGGHEIGGGTSTAEACSRGHIMPLREASTMVRVTAMPCHRRRRTYCIVCTCGARGSAADMSTSKTIRLLAAVASRSMQLRTIWVTFPACAANAPPVWRNTSRPHHPILRP